MLVKIIAIGLDHSLTFVSHGEYGIKVEENDGNGKCLYDKLPHVVNCDADHVIIFTDNPNPFNKLLFEGEFEKHELYQHVDVALQVQVYYTDGRKKQRTIYPFSQELFLLFASHMCILLVKLWLVYLQ